MTEILIQVPSETVLEKIIPLLNNLKVSFKTSFTHSQKPEKIERNYSSPKNSLMSETCKSNFSNKIKYFEEGD